MLLDEQAVWSTRIIMFRCEAETASPAVLASGPAPGDVRYCRNEYLLLTHIYTLHGMLIHGLLTCQRLRHSFSIVLTGNQIADSARLSAIGDGHLVEHRSAGSAPGVWKTRRSGCPLS